MQAEIVIQVPNVTLPNGDPLIAAITDITISEDNKFLYFSNWLQGDLRQYDISSPRKPKLVSQLYVGGKDPAHPAPTLRGKFLNGGPQMLRLSADGQRLYLTNSLFSSWDEQFYGLTGEKSIIANGSYMIEVNTNVVNGQWTGVPMTLNQNFLVDFADHVNASNGPCLAHETHIIGVSHH